MFFILESAGILIGILFIFLYATESPRPARFVTRAALVSVSSWIAEESCIRLYRFYAYHPDWNLFVGEVPLLVIITWPVIISSAMDLVSRFDWVLRRMSILAGAALVATDALFIEPLSAAAGLWQWRFPGIFGVPPVGILGWFFFALLTILLLENDRLQERRLPFSLLLLVFPVIGTHVLLLLAWWGVLRWINFPLPLTAVVGAVWCVSFLMVGAIHKNQICRRIKKRTLLMRLPAALFFFALLTFKAPDSLPLWIYALAFVPPYVMIMVQQYKGVDDKIP
jgi:hypothetical protein